jgi:hypothetical protein
MLGLQTLSRIAFFAASAVVLALALLPHGIGGSAPGPDKLHHLLAFSALTLFGSLGWPGRLLQVAAALLAFGAGIEVLQGTELIERDAEVLDWVADAAGIVSAALVTSFVRRLAT